MGVRVDAKMDRIAPAGPDDPAADAVPGTAWRQGDVLRGLAGSEAAARAFVPVAHRMFLDADETPRRALLQRARSDPALAGRLLSDVVPAVAVLLGRAWATDQLSFVDVTIASVRLQSLVRALTPTVRSDRADPVAIVVPPWEQHALAPALALAALRRSGVDARALPGTTAQAIAADLARRPPKGVLVSVGSRRSAARLPDLVASIRRAQLRRVPIVVGGPAVLADFATCRNSGADLVTNDPRKALRFCGIRLGTGADEEAVVDA